MNKGLSYDLFYDILLNLRENFHSYGRIDDSNAKLDEIVKLISLSYYEATNGNSFNLEFVKTIAKNNFDDENNVAMALRYLFENACSTDMFSNADRTNIFGANPSLNIQPSENTFAEKLIFEISKIDFVGLIKNKDFTNFDIINECFGHFVRDNFRNNKEDAQYMTPSEITNCVLDMVFSDMDKDAYLSHEKIQQFKIMDPTCGVGTLLVESCHRFTSYIKKLNISEIKKNATIEAFRNSGVLGQDKVDRMVRLSKINTLLMGGNISNIFSGNSIIGNSKINANLANIDFIFTNPPFGAEYDADTIDKSMFPLISQLHINNTNISSELLMLDKCIALLKDGGYLAIVLPDSFFSAKGLNSQLRELILKTYDVRAIVELPAVTFAQAGTRTKTSILYLRKQKPVENSKVVMAVCKDIGYTVKERVGVPVKIADGENQMLKISSFYNTSFSSDNISGDDIVSFEPSVTIIKRDSLIEGVLNPSFYNADRLKTIIDLNKFITKGYELKKLSEIADFVTLKRKSFYADDQTKHISVLHINNDGTINYNEVNEFKPISKGRECKEGDLIFSKINPRIPRMSVVQNSVYRMVCSTEFEILRPRGRIDVYVLSLILKSSYVSNQIENLTSGTSSSHNRIKREQLEEILIPYPSGDKAISFFEEVGANVKEAIKLKYMADDIFKSQIELLELI